jgi:hypothetical protein
MKRVKNDLDNPCLDDIMPVQEFKMKVTHKRTPAERKMQYQSSPKGLAKRSAYKRQVRKDHVPQFVGVDSEGIGDGKNHRAVLLGVGSAQYVAKDKRRGLHYDEVFDFLYSEFLKYPADTVFVGFYLKYDFNEWLKTLPEDAARMLLTTSGREIRKPKRRNNGNNRPFPVRIGTWEIDMLAFKTLSIRPRGCTCIEDGIKCEHESAPWMTICDAGSFFQKAFIKVLEEWKDICTPEEFALVLEGKEKRATARLDKKMKVYNALENELLARVMTKYAEAFKVLDIKLRRDQWYGPGAVAQAWLRQNKIIKHEEILQIPGMPEWLSVCQKSYYGGWFEIFSHGIIKGTTYNYDINSAYPYATTKLPHICNQCRTRTGKGTPKNRSDYMLLHCTVRSKGNRIGAVPHRTKNGSILRPNISRGWYWAHELDAANRAGLVKEIDIHGWMDFVPCSHAKPFGGVGALYDKRNEVGKDTPLGIAIKLVINSIYGKFAQSVGTAPYNNWFYASYITSHCRTQILDAIASVPGKANSVLMVATDGICFDQPCPDLPIQVPGQPKKLGEWDMSKYTDLCLFKPGVYWHADGKQELKLKSRGVSAKEFAKGIFTIEHLFQNCLDHKVRPGTAFGRLAAMDLPDYDGDIRRVLGDDGWPQYLVTIPFAMTSCVQALARKKWHTAANVKAADQMIQSSDPYIKRTGVKFNLKKKRLDTVFHTLSDDECQTHYYLDPKVIYPKKRDLGYGFFNAPIDDIIDAVGTARDKAPGYDIDIDGEYEWVTIWNGGPVDEH